MHGRWFVDLDVFHKGHARARDREGWFHIDARGDALFAERFASVEPFYNGQSFAERHDGSQCVIGHDGAPVVEVAPSWSTRWATDRASSGLRVLLIGLSAVGKTTVGRLLATRWGVPFVSIDDCRRRWGDGSVAGDHLARAMFLRACGTLGDGVFETSGAGPYRHATKAALAEGAGAVVVCWLDAPADVRGTRRGAPPDDLPYPAHAQGHWSDADAEATLADDFARGWWSTDERWSAHRVDANQSLDRVVATIATLVAGRAGR